jgi:hypothetical protein
MVIDDLIWYGPVGIARQATLGGERRYFIGISKSYDEREDYQRICRWGERFDDEAGDLLFRRHGRTPPAHRPPGHRPQRTAFQHLIAGASR